MGIYKKYWAKEVPEGICQEPTSLVATTYPPGRGYRACGHPGGPLAPLFCYMKGFIRKKSREELLCGFSTATRRHLRRTKLELWQDDPAGETSLPKGEIIAIVITNTPLVGGEASSSISSSAPSPLQYLRLVAPIGTCKVASSVDYSL